jgi:hypothetical protein
MLRGSLTEIPVISEKQECLLFEAAKSLNKYKTEPIELEKNLVYRGRGHKRGDVKPWDTYNLTEVYFDVLRKRGWHCEGRRGVETYWRRPGKSRGISATANYNDSGLFHVFSSNAHPLDADRAYTPFTVLALLDFGGDYKAAYREITKKK